MVAIPQTEEVDEFVDSVNEVSMLIDGLKAGTISPEYIDARHLKNQREAGPAAAGKLTAPASSKPNNNTKDVKKDDSDSDQQKEEADKAKQEELMHKVLELKANRERKLKARNQYENYVNRGHGNKHWATDYTKWDMWCPEDEEDELFNSLTPNNAAFRALEKDIDERHKRMVEQRQIAERQRVRGNDAFKEGQFSEALRCYQLGLESEKTNMALHANAAAAALKIHCYVQAIEHCDKVFGIANFLHNNPSHPLCGKAHMRRALAYQALTQFERAAADINAALDITPGDKELLRVKTKIDLDLTEQNKQKALQKALSRSGQAGSEGTSTTGLDVGKLKQIEDLVCQLRQAGEAGAQPGSDTAAREADAGSAKTGGDHGPKLPAKKARGAGGAAAQPARPTGTPAAQLIALLQGDDQGCVYFRACGGVALCTKTIEKQVSSSATTSGPVNLAEQLELLCVAAVNDGNLAQLLQSKPFIPAVLTCLTSGQTDTALAAARLLCTAVTMDDLRKAVSQELNKSGRADAVVGVLCSAEPRLQALLLLLLGNCSVDASCKSALLKCLQAPSCSLTALLEGCIKQGGDEVAERALTLVANMCGGEELRAKLLSGSSPTTTTTTTTATALPAGKGLSGAVTSRLISATSPAKSPASSLARAAATCLYNLGLDPRTQEAVAGSGQLPLLLKLLTHPDELIVARAVGVVSRCIKHPDAARQVSQHGGISQLVQLADQLLSRCGKQEQGSADVAAEVVDMAVRSLTVLVSSTDNQEQAKQVVAAGGVTSLHHVLTTAGISPATLGNAALSLANIAKHQEHIQQSIASRCVPGKPAQEEEELQGGGVPTLEQAKECLMAALLRVAYQGQGAVLAKNAGIALARLAGHTPLLARLKELRGLEIIHASVKSL